MGSCASTTNANGTQAVTPTPSIDNAVKPSSALAANSPTPAHTKVRPDDLDPFFFEDEQASPRAGQMNFAAPMNSSTAGKKDRPRSNAPVSTPTGASSSDSLQRSSSQLSSSSSGTNFNSVDFGTYVSDCDSGDLLSTTGSDSDGSDVGYSQFYSGGTGAGEHAGNAKEMENYYNEFVKKHGGGMKTAQQIAQRPTAQDLLRARASATQLRNASVSGGGQKAGTAGTPGGFFHSSFGTDTNNADTGKGRSGRKRNKKKKLRDPVDPGLYVDELYRYCREKMRGGKIVVDPDGEMRRLYPTQGWHRLKPVRDAQAPGTSPFMEALRQRNGNAPSAGADGSFGYNDDKKEPEQEKSLAPTDGHKKHRRNTHDTTAPEIYSTAHVAPRRPTEPILLKPTHSSFSRQPGGAEEQEEERRRQNFTQRRRVSFAEDTKDFRSRRRDTDEGNGNGFGEAPKQFPEVPTVEDAAAVQQQLELLKGKMRPVPV